MDKLIAKVTFAFVLSVVADASHFRGGIISYKPNGNPYTVDFFVRLAYRRSVVSCDNNVITQKNDLSTGESWEGTMSSSSSSGTSLSIYCNDYNDNEDWIEGYRQFTLTGSQHDQWWKMRIIGGNWIDSLVQHSGSNIELQTTFKHSTRANNYSPVSDIPLTVYVPVGTSTNLKIPVYDPDGDIVRCRLANSQECNNGFCTYWPHGTIDENSCTITYNGAGSEGELYPVFLKLEDYAPGTTHFDPSKSYGSVDLQFLIRISRESVSTRVRLQSGSQTSGRLEVLHNGAWGTVCDDYWTMTSSHVACRQLGFESAVSFAYRDSGATDEILLDYVQCTGTENMIQECPHRGWGVHGCSHGEDVHLDCKVPDNCASSPCSNGRTCVNANINGYRCHCPYGYTGQQCETNHKTRVTCEDDHMEITLVKSYFPSVDWRNLHLKDTSCRAAETSNTITLQTALDSCGTTYTENNNDIEFQNEVGDDQQYKSGEPSSAVTRDHLIVLPFYCKYSRKKLVSTSFSPSKRLLYASEGSFGNFTFTMNLYHTSQYQTPYSPLDYPVPVSLNENLWVQFEVKNTIADLEIFADSCRATTSTDPNSSPQYGLLDNGCVRDSTMVYNYNSGSAVQRFSIKSFDFVYSNNQLVYLHCELIVCHRNSANSRCSRGCISSRRRRESSKYGGSSKPYDLSVGPFKEKSKATNNAAQVSKVTIGTSAGLGVVVGLLLVVGGVMLFKKLRKVYRSPASVEPSPPVATAFTVNAYVQHGVNLDEKLTEIAI